MLVAKKDRTLSFQRQIFKLVKGEEIPPFLAANMSDYQKRVYFEVKEETKEQVKKPVQPRKRTANKS